MRDARTHCRILVARTRASENYENHPPVGSQWDGASLTFDISIWGSAAADPSLECHQQGASVTIMSAARRSVARRQSGYFWTNSYVTSWPMRCPESVLVTVTTVLTLVGQVVPGPSVPTRLVNEPLQSFTVPESWKPTSASAVDAKTITGRLFRYHRLLKPRRVLLWPLRNFANVHWQL